jgi:myosin-crossreactive antigen
MKECTMNEVLQYFILHTSMLLYSSQNFMKDQQLIIQFYIVFFYVFFFNLRA